MAGLIAMSEGFIMDECPENDMEEDDRETDALVEQGWVLELTRENHDVCCDVEEIGGPVVGGLGEHEADTIDGSVLHVVTVGIVGDDEDEGESKEGHDAGAELNTWGHGEHFVECLRSEHLGHWIGLEMELNLFLQCEHEEDDELREGLDIHSLRLLLILSILYLLALA